MTRVLICGGDAWANQGDSAILAGTLEALQEVLPQAHLMVASDQPAKTRATHGVPAVFRRNPIALLRALWRADLVLWGGGQLLQNASSKTFLLAQLGLLALAKGLRKKVMAYGQGIGPVSGQLSRWLSRLIVNRLDLLTVRDEESLRQLHELGITRPLIRRTADPAMLLTPAPAAQAEALLRAQGITSPFVIIAVRRWGHYQSHLLPVRFQIRRLPVAHERWFQGFLSTLAQAADTMVEQLGVSVLFVPMCPGGDQGDDQVSEDIRARMGHGERSRVLATVRTPAELKAIFGRADLVVGMRMHALILAADMGIPVVGISYQKKAESFLRLVGLERYCLRVEILDPEALWEKVEAAWHARDRLREENAQRMPALRALALVNAHLAKRLLLNEKKGHPAGETSSSEAARWHRLAQGTATHHDALLPRRLSRHLRQRRDLCLQLAQVQAGQVVLDLGCGPGAYSAAITAHQARWVGLDRSGEMVRLARDGNHQSPAGPPWLIHGEALALPLRSESVDTILCAGLLDYLPATHLLHASREMVRVLKPGGRLVLTVNRFDPVRWLRSRLPIGVPKPWQVPGPAYFHAGTLPSLLAESGWDLEGRGIVPSLFALGGTLVLGCRKGAGPTSCA